MRIFTRSQIDGCGKRRHFVVLSSHECTITMQARQEHFAEIFADLLVTLVPAFTTTEAERVD